MSHPKTDDCWRACYHDGDIDSVRGFLSEGVGINDRAPCSGACPLDAALGGEHLPLVKFLLAEGADPNGVGYGDWTPLMAAVNFQMLEPTTWLLDHGADPDLPSPKDGLTPLHVVAMRGFAKGSAACARLLLAAGANPNVHAKDGIVTTAFASGTKVIGETPLHYAAAYGTQDLIALLIENGADKNATDARGDTPLQWYGRHQRTSPHVMVDRGTRDSLE